MRRHPSRDLPAEGAPWVKAWEESMPGRVNSQREGPAAGAWVAFLKAARA